MPPRRLPHVLLLLTLGLASAPFPAVGAEWTRAAFDPERWNLDRATVSEHLGRTAIAGTAVLEGIDFRDGIVEVDLAVTGARSYPGILFHRRSDQESERVYLRPHRAGLYPDAVQYAPVRHGVTAWQLYHGEGNTTAASFPHDTWFTLRLEIRGSQARVFLDGAETAVLEIDHLRHGATGGGIALLGPRNGSAWFSDFRYVRDADLAFDPPAKIETPEGTLATWEVSGIMDAEQVPQGVYPRFYGIFLTPWRTVHAEPEGFVDLTRLGASSRPHPKTVWARKTIRSDVKRDLSLSLGYSDDVSVFLNRRLIFTGRSGYRSRDPSFVGALGLHDTIHLPLEPGLNEIFLAVTDSFGGWGFIARTDDATPEPRTRRGDLGPVWETDAVFATPESVVYDRERERLYVSNFDKVDPARVGTGFISRLTLDGEVETLRWISGLDGPCGMAIDGDRLYVVEAFRGKLVEIDLDRGEILARHDVPEGHTFLNDLAVHASGDVYITDTSRGWGQADVYRFRSGGMDTSVDGYDLHRANGILVDGDRLVVGSVGEGLLKRFDLTTGKLEVLAALGAGVIDGIRTDNDGNYLVSHWEGKIFRVSPEGEVFELIDLRERGLNAADFEFVHEHDLLVVPTFLGNRVLAYRLAPSMNAAHS